MPGTRSPRTGSTEPRTAALRRAPGWDSDTRPRRRAGGHVSSKAVTEILSAVRAGSRDGNDLPDGLVRLCARTLPVSGVGLALMTDDGPAGTVAVSDGGALHLEELQFTLGQGPCVDAS